MLTCRDQGRQLSNCLHSIKGQLGPRDEIIIVDDGFTDPFTVQILDHWYRESGLKVIRTGDVGLVRARAMGLSRSQGAVVFALGAEQVVDATYLDRAMRVLESDTGIAFVTCGLYDESTGFVWIADSASLSGLTGCHRIPFPVVRREQLEQAGGYDASFERPEQSDWELVLRLSEGGAKGGIDPQGAGDLLYDGKNGDVSVYQSRAGKTKTSLPESLERSGSGIGKPETSLASAPPV